MTAVVITTQPTDKMIAVLQHVRDNPGQSKLAAAQSLCPPSSLRYAYIVVSRCVDLGWLTASRTGAAYRVDLTDLGRNVLEAFGYRSWS